MIDKNPCLPPKAKQGFGNLERKMSGAGTPDFFYREAQRLGYVARSAFKV
jgi:hypothetical protein